MTFSAVPSTAMYRARWISRSYRIANSIGTPYTNDPAVVATRLSVLDVAPVGPGVSGTQALAWTTDVARAAERIGFHRIWVAEHHGVLEIAASAPAVLIAHLAAHTSRLQLGAGGVMLPNHAPLVVAEQFATLNALYPGRIDLGIGKAKGSDEVTARALGRAPDGGDDAEFAARLDELLGFLDGELPEQHPFERVHVSPNAPAPPVFLLASSVEGARRAAVRALPLAFAHHLVPEATVAALASYRAAFRSSPRLHQPYVIVTALVVCAATQDAAERAAVAATAVRVRRSLARRTGRTPNATDLADPSFTDEEAELVAGGLTREGVIVGTPESVRRRLVSLVETTGADEIMLCPIEFEGSARIRTIEAVADAGVHGSAG